MPLFQITQTCTGQIEADNIDDAYEIFETDSSAFLSDTETSITPA